MMTAKIRYLWKDDDGNEQISKDQPIEAARWMMGAYTPNYRKVVIIEIEDD